MGAIPCFALGLILSFLAIFSGELSLAPSCASEAYVVMEAQTGTILAEKNGNEELLPASITKVMTLLLLFDGVSQGKISLEDPVCISAHAASMGGSQVYLEEGEIQKVGDLIKCISISSANDAAVAMAEYLEGSEEAFVEQMNKRAKELGMEHTHFMNCCGLDEDVSKDHYSSAKDVAIMSRELLNTHPEVSSYALTWMDSITHVTKKGESQFSLTNTNKLVKTYPGLTGLKTGYTGKAGHCISASAQKNGIHIIAVVLKAPNSVVRFQEATALLNFGFSKVEKYQDDRPLWIDDKEYSHLKVHQGEMSEVPIVTEPFSCILCKGEDREKIQKKVELPESLEAPVEQGQQVGNVSYSYQGTPLGDIGIFAGAQVKAKTFPRSFIEILGQVLVA